MAKFICYHKPSLFLHKHESFTQKLITLSRIEINVQLDQTTFSPNHWKRVKKSGSFDQIFEKRSNSDCYNLKNQVCDEEFSMGASSFTNILKLNVNDTAYNMKTTNLKAMSTNKNVPGEDGSTIISTKSVPTNIDVIDNKFITGRKYRNSGNHQNLAHAQSYFQQTQRK